MTAAPPLDEFQRIARFFAPLATSGALGLADDVALIDGPPGEQYVLKTDAIVEGVHFLASDPAGQVAQKLLRVNLSDLAAKGARPLGYLLTTALPKTRDEAWLAGFAAGLAEDQARFGIGLLGGDSVAIDGPVTLSVAAIGRVAAGRAVLRSGAQPGDHIYVTGSLGDAALGLALLRGDRLGVDDTAAQFLADRYRLPQPRLAVGQGLIGIAHAMMDISDGLVQDLGHLANSSGLAAIVEATSLPLSPAFQQAISHDRRHLMAALAGGDDYELLLTAPAAATTAIAALARETGIAITAIGRMQPGRGVRVVDGDGAAMAIPVEGYRHF